jgi:HK97 family phage prohead protease
MFNNHNTDQVLATTRNGSLMLTEDARGLRVEAKLPDTTLGRDLSTLIADGTVHSMSFGFSVPQGGDSWSADGSSRVLREVVLHEVSVVQGFPAYPDTAGASVRTDDDDVVASAPGVPVALMRRKFELNAKRSVD